jgi:hypothetical protein
MTTYINVGARIVGAGQVLSKRDLRRRVAEDPDSLRFYATAVLGPRRNGETMTLSELDDEDVVFSVCGPDPFNDRRWYACVRRVGPRLRVD